MNDNAGGYRSSLTGTDVRYIELRCGKLMRHFGYPLDNDVTSGAPGEAEAERLEPGLSPGRYVVEDAHEVGIRQRRLEAMQRVLGRRLT